MAKAKKCEVEDCSCSEWKKDIKIEGLMKSTLEESNLYVDGEKCSALIISIPEGTTTCDVFYAGDSRAIAGALTGCIISKEGPFKVALELAKEAISKGVRSEEGPCKGEVTFKNLGSIINSLSDTSKVDDGEGGAWGVIQFTKLRYINC